MAERSCVVCGTKQDKQTLRRFVWRDEAPFLDEKAILPGRGAYCCANDDCLTSLLKMHKKWKRIFRL